MMDPSQTVTSNERKTEYRDLLDIIENLNDNDNISTTDPTKRINETLTRVNILFKAANIKEKVKHTDEVLLDAKVIATASDVLLKVTGSIDCALDVYDSIDFARKIRSKLINEEADEDSDAYYADLIKATQGQGFYYTVPSYYTFLGLIGKATTEPSSKLKERKVRTKNTRDEQAHKKAPERLTHAVKEEDSVDETVKFLQWSLMTEYEENGNKPLNYYHFIVDPNSFTNSVQNMFHLSFLVRDGRVKIDTGIAGTGNLLISPVSSHDIKKAKKGQVDYKQFIFSIDITQWTEIIETQNIETYFLEERKKIWDKKKQEEI